MVFNIVFWDSLIVWLFISVAEAVMPWLTPKSIQFGVRIPPDKIGSSEVLEPRRSFVMVQLLIAAGAFLGLVLLPLIEGVSWLMTAAPVAVLAASFPNYLRVRRGLIRLKNSEGWFSGVSQQTFVEVQDGAEPRVNFLYMLPAVAVLLLTVVVGVDVYPSLPSIIPVHFTASGQANGFASKSSPEAFTGIIMQAVLLVMFTGIAAAVVRTRRSIESHAPSTSLWQQNRFKSIAARMMLLMSFFIGLTLMLSQFSIWGVIPRADAALTVIPSLVGVIGLTIPMMRAGQYGSRLKPSANEQGTGIANVDDDRVWKAGAVYFNRGDRAILVPKRFGVGWTFNFANPLSWLILAVIIALPVVLVLIIRFVH